MSTDADPYEILGIPHDAGRSQIEEAYARLSSRFHPDRFPHGGNESLREEASRMFSRIQSARDSLLQEHGQATPEPVGTPRADEPKAAEIESLSPRGPKAEQSVEKWRVPWLLFGGAGGVVIGAVAVLAIVLAISGGSSGNGTGQAADSVAPAGGSSSDALGMSAVAGDSGGDVDVCGLLTTDEIREATGMAVGTGVPDDEPPNFYRCWWWAPEVNGLYARVYVGDPGLPAWAWFEPEGVQHEDVRGLGDAAYWMSDESALEVLSGDYSLAIEIVEESESSPSDDLRQIAVGLGRQALGRLSQE